MSFFNKLSAATTGAVFVSLATFCTAQSVKAASLSGDYLISISLDGKAQQIGRTGFDGVYGLTFNNGELRGYTSANQEIDINSATGAGTFVRNITGVSGSIYGATNSTFGVTFLNTSTGQVGTVDTSTGIFTSFSAGRVTFGDIAISSNNDLFGTDLFPDYGLYSINQSTGSSSSIGSDDGFINALGFTSNNVLYGAGYSQFYTVDTSSGARSVVANIPGFSSSGDIVFDSANNRFFATSSSPITAVPEPSSILGTLAFGALGTSYLVRRKLKNSSTC